MEYKYLLFDLDGTLTNPHEGITKSFQYALRHYGIEESLENLNRVIGPPLADSFMQFYGMDKSTALSAVEKYRERFAAIGIHENIIYPGISEMLCELKKHGKIISLTTSKPLVFAKKILAGFDIAQYFTVQMGSELDGTRNKKSEVIAEVIRLLGNPPKSKILMIGDRRQDIEGAKAEGISSLGVRFGFAEQGELEQAGADYIVDTVTELKEFLLR